MRPGTALLLLCLTLGVAPPAAADAGATTPLQVPDSAAPTFAVYGSREGLSDEIWSTVGVDRDGFVWAGSASALARFDGYRWQTQPLPDATSLVRDMASDADGNLWAIFEREGLARYDGVRWRLVGPPRFHQRFSIVDGPGGRELWVAHNRGLARLADGVWREDAGNAGLRAGRAIAYARTTTLYGEPREWLASADNGLWYRARDPGGAPQPWKRLMLPEVQDMAMTDLLVSHDAGREELWALSYGGGVARLRDDGTHSWRSDRGELPTEAMYSIVETRSAGGERLLWIATRAGLLRYRAGLMEVFDRRHGLPADAIRGVKVHHGSDGVDTLWVATEGGLARATLGDSPWHTVSLLGANENGTFGVLLEPNGRGGERLWVGSSQRGLALLDAGHWRYFTQAAGDLPARGVRGLWRLPGADGRPHRLLAMTGAPLLEIDDTLAVRALPTPWPVVPEGAVLHALSRELGGAVEWWIATSHAGVYRLRGGRWTAYPHLGGDDPAPVLQLAKQRDSAGRAWLWAADSLGLARFDGERWERLPAALALPEDGFRSLLLLDENGRQTLWAGSTHHGILRIDVSNPRQPRALPADELPAPPDPVIYSLVRDGRGRVYVCTNNGVQQLTPVAGDGWESRVFRRRDGLVHDECNGNGQFVDAHDRYWVGTLGGLSMFEPDSAAPDAGAASPRPLYVTAVSIDGEPRPLPQGEVLELPPGLRELRIEYSLLTGQREGESRYRTQLHGLERGLGKWTGERSRVFGALRPGDYELFVEARDHAGVVAAPLRLKMSVAPRWWQQTWLQLLAAASALLAAAAAMGLYNRGLRERQSELREEVAARTADLHEANLRLTDLSYRDALTGIANRRRLVEAMASAMERAIDQEKPIGLIVADVDHFKRYNDRHGHLAGDAALKAIAAAMGSAMREQDLVARFGGEEFACLMIDADAETVARVAERMRVLVEALPPRALGNDVQTLTLSAGTLCRVPRAGDLPEDLLHAADAALYAAKAAGRNRILAAD